MRKSAFCIRENEGADQLHGTVQLISALVFSTQFLTPKFQASSHLLWLYLVRKPAFCICEKTISFAVIAKLISAFVFVIRIVQSPYYLNPKFQASSHLLWLYRPFCVGPVGNPDDWFSHNEAHMSGLCRTWSENS